MQVSARLLRHPGVLAEIRDMHREAERLACLERLSRPMDADMQRLVDRLQGRVH